MPSALLATAEVAVVFRIADASTIDVELTPTPAATPTPAGSPSILLVIGQDAAPRGGVAVLVVTAHIDPSGAEVGTEQIDAVVERAVFETVDPPFDCDLDPRLQDDFGGGFGVPVEPIDPERERIRMFALPSNILRPARPLDTGDTFVCELRVRADAPLGPSPVLAEGVEASDYKGQLWDARGEDGTFEVMQAALPVVSVGAGETSAIAGGLAQVAILLQDASADLHLTSAQVEVALLIFQHPYSGSPCEIDPRLGDQYSVQAQVVGGASRLRLSVNARTISPTVFLTDGPLFTCGVRLAATTKAGHYALRGRGATVRGTTPLSIPARPLDGSIEVLAAPTPTITPTRLPSPTPTSTRPAGDCSGDGIVSAAEKAFCVDLALGNRSGPTCAACDTNGDHRVDVADLVAIVAAGL